VCGPPINSAKILKKYGRFYNSYFPQNGPKKHNVLWLKRVSLLPIVAVWGGGTSLGNIRFLGAERNGEEVDKLISFRGGCDDVLEFLTRDI
jgi:hypothetical protein